MAQTGVDALTGRWKYRSFHNNPTFRMKECQQCGDVRRELIFGEAELVMDDFAPSEFRGRLVFESGAEMALVGTSLVGNPFTIRFQGRGVTPGIEHWVYDYIGYLLPDWPNGVDQRPAIVGSIVRTAPHDGNPAGVVASWIAVKQDEIGVS